MNTTDRAEDASPPVAEVATGIEAPIAPQATELSPEEMYLSPEDLLTDLDEEELYAPPPPPLADFEVPPPPVPEDFEADVLGEIPAPPERPMATDLD
ncbi:MAG: hypothetical protein R3C12_15135 [Planctomycetaceae bacterium]|nr:hypothetical protein [Planctomycetaceae bacterium]